MRVGNQYILPVDTCHYAGKSNSEELKWHEGNYALFLPLSTGSVGLEIEPTTSMDSYLSVSRERAIGVRSYPSVSRELVMGCSGASGRAQCLVKLAVYSPKYKKARTC